MCCFALAGIFEHRAFAEMIKLHVLEHIALPAAVISFCIMTLTMCELLIVSLTAATVMVILAVVHNIPIMLASIILYHDHIFRNQWIGFFICSVGAAVYFYARGIESHGEAHARDVQGTSLVQPAPSRMARA